MHPVDHIKSLARLTPESEEKLLSMMRGHTFRKGDVLQGVGGLLSFTFFITSGCARVFFTANGKEHTISFNFDDQFIFISRELLLSHAESIAVEFLEPTTVVIIPHLKVKDFLTAEKAVTDVEGLLFMNTALLEHCTFIEERLRILQSCNAAERFRWVTTRYPRILQTATLTQIASYIGVTKETVYRLKGKISNRSKE